MAAITGKKRTLAIPAAPAACAAVGRAGKRFGSRRFARRLFVCCTLNGRAQRNRQASHEQSRLEHTSAFGFDFYPPLFRCCHVHKYPCPVA